MDKAKLQKKIEEKELEVEKIKAALYRAVGQLDMLKELEKEFSA